MNRTILFVICLLVGAASSAVAWYVTSSEWSFVTIPACLAVGWFFVANPEKCLEQECSQFKSEKDAA